MALINLLPWREFEREERKKEFFVWIGLALAGTLVIVAFAYMVASSMVRSQRYLNEILRQEISQLDQQITAIRNIKEEKQRLVARMEIIQALQSERPLIVRFFDEMVRIIPQGVFITEVERRGNKIIITGRAESNTRVSELMRGIESSQWVSAPTLTQIRTPEDDDENQMREFQLEMRQKFSINRAEEDAQDGMRPVPIPSSF